MSVDFVVAVPADRWPDVAAVQRCMIGRAYPVRIKRFPAMDPGRVVTDGVLAAIDGSDAYLESQLGSASNLPGVVTAMNDRPGRAGAADRVGDRHAIIALQVRKPIELRAASYVIAALIVCFDGIGFEPQGNTGGRTDFADTLLAGSEALKGL